MSLDVSNKLKEKARNIFHSVLESLDKKEDTPPKPPPKAENPIPEFNKLYVCPNHSSPPQASNGFVGGFYPNVNISTYNPSSAPHFSNGRPSYSHRKSSSSSARPMAMPVPFSNQPQSLTMQMALRPPGDDLQLLRPQSHPGPASPTSISSSSSSTPPKQSKKKPISSPSTPVKGSKGDSPSAPPTPKAGQEQCAGVTKAGKRCTRMVKTKAALSAFDSDEGGSSSSIPRFCYQHKKELMGPTGYYARKNGEWVPFEAWIPAYLQEETQVSLRVEMEKVRSQSDVEGYIYTFEIREPKEKEVIKLKVGRAVNLVKRIDQWGKQCGSKEQVLRGFYPGSVEPDEDGNEGSLMKGRVKAGEKGPWCHRLERLIHLELADLACTTVYLDPSWPNIESPPSADTVSTTAKDSNLTSPCPDCGTMHKEIFEFKRWKHGSYEGKEWDQLVKPVIDRWGRFVELYV